MSTHPLVFPSTCFRQVLLACPPFPPWNLPSFTVESTLSTPCSRSDPFFLAKVRLSPTLTLSLLMIWCFGQTALFLFLLAKAAPAFLPTAFSVALRPLFPFRQAQYAQVFPLKPAPFCTLFAGLGNTNKSVIFLLFSYYLTLVLSSPPCPLLHLSSHFKLCGISGRTCLLSLPVLLDYNGSQDTRFSRETKQRMSWPDGVRYLRPPQSLVVSLLLTLVSTLVLSRTEGVLSHRSSLTLNPSCSACGHLSQDTSHLILHCPATDSLRRSLFGDSLSLYDRWSRPWGVSRFPGLHGLPPCPHPSEGIG